MESSESSPHPPRPGDVPPSAGGRVAGQADPVPHAPSPGRKGWALPAWLVIAAVCLLTIVGRHLAPLLAQSDGDDPVGVTIMQLQAKYLVGAARLFPVDAGVLYRQAEGMLNLGTVSQRQRFVIIAAELAGPAEARVQLEQLDALIADPPNGEPVELNETQASIRHILHKLYPEALADVDAEQAAQSMAQVAAELSPADQDVLVDQLGWFGALALAPAGTDNTAAREAALRSARIVAIVLLSAALLAVAAGFFGLVALVLLVVFTLTDKLRSGLGYGGPYHAIYAETFAVWLVLLLGLQVLGGLLTTPGTEMLLTVIVFFGSLVALAWPVVRGIPWPTVRKDVGLTLGRLPLVEPFIGVGGYLATLPLLAVGLLVTLGLMAVQSALSGDQPTFAPSGGPAHPIIVQMSGPDIWPKLQVLFLAAVAAPIVEETMFRGVLYRHLRDASARLGLALSVLLSATFSGFVFAVIHPQGWVAVPALMSLAYGFVLVREWRGTLIPSMVIHAVSNGLVVSMFLIVLGV